MAARVYPDFLRMALRIAALIVAGCFVATFLVPFDTMGDPAFEIIQLRRSWFLGYGVIWLHIALVIGLIWRMARHPGWAVAAALAASATAFVLMNVEQGQLIGPDAMILSHNAVMSRLNVNRFGTAALSVIAFLALWRVDARH
jgi:hypothetical protein